MTGRKVERREPVTRGTGNVFADLGFPDSAERQAKLRLAHALNQVVEGRKLSQAEAAIRTNTAKTSRRWIPTVVCAAFNSKMVT